MYPGARPSLRHKLLEKDTAGVTRYNSNFVVSRHPTLLSHNRHIVRGISTCLRTNLFSQTNNPDVHPTNQSLRARGSFIYSADRVFREPSHKTKNIIASEKPRNAWPSECSEVLFYFQIFTAPSLLPDSNIFVGSSVTLTSNTASSWLVRGATSPFSISCIDGGGVERIKRRQKDIVWSVR